MIQLIKIELRKTKIQKYILYAFLISLGICFFTTISIFGSEQDKSNNYFTIIWMMTMATVDCYLLYACILCIKIIIEEYSNKTMMVLFTYPVKRKSILYAKIIIVEVMSLLMFLITEIIGICYLSGTDKLFHWVNGDFNLRSLSEWIEFSLMGGFAVFSFSLIVIGVGMWKKSSSVLFITTLLLLLIFHIIISQEGSMIQNMCVIFVIFILGSIFLHCSMKKI